MLNGEEIVKLIEEENFIQSYPHLETQIQPNGFDVTVGEMFRFKGPGKLDFSNSERELSECEEIKPERKEEDDKYGWWELNPGVYKVRTNEKFDMPKDLAAIAFPRSSLMRIGCMTQTGAWDAGFTGKAEFLLLVKNPEGAEIKENARVAQLIFLPLDEVKEGYGGVYNE